MAEQNNQIQTAEQEKEETRELRRQQSLERTILRQETKEKNKNEEVEKEEQQGVKKGISLFTAQALKFAWLNLIDSFGLTLIYINFHFLGKYFVGSQLFSEFGEEWLPPTPAGQAIGSRIRGGAIKWFEIIALFCLDILIVMLILVALIISITPLLMIAAVISGLAGTVGL